MYVSVVFGRVGGVSNRFVPVHPLLWKAKTIFEVTEGGSLDLSESSVSLGRFDGLHDRCGKLAPA